MKIDNPFLCATKHCLLLSDIIVQRDNEAMHEDEVPPTAPSYSHVNEDSFQLMFNLMDSMATSIENLMNLVTNHFLVYDANFANISQSLEDINEHLRRDGMWLHCSYVFDDAKGEKEKRWYDLVYFYDLAYFVLNLNFVLCFDYAMFSLTNALDRIVLIFCNTWMFWVLQSFG